MAPLVRPCCVTKSSDSSDSTSTSAFPTPTTSSGASTAGTLLAPPVPSAPVPESFRLPRSVLPQRYDLRIEPDLDGASFAGTEAVSVQVVEPVAEVVLNANE